MTTQIAWLLSQKHSRYTQIRSERSLALSQLPLCSGGLFVAVGLSESSTETQSTFIPPRFSLLYLEKSTTCCSIPWNVICPRAYFTTRWPDGILYIWYVFQYNMCIVSLQSSNGHGWGGICALKKDQHFLHTELSDAPPEKMRKRKKGFHINKQKKFLHQFKLRF